MGWNVQVGIVKDLFQFHAYRWYNVLDHLLAWLADKLFNKASWWCALLKRPFGGKTDLINPRSIFSGICGGLGGTRCRPGELRGWVFAGRDGGALAQEIEEA